MMECCTLDILGGSDMEVKWKGEWDLKGMRRHRSSGKVTVGGVAVMFSKKVWERVYEHRETSKRMMHVKVKNNLRSSSILEPLLLEHDLNNKTWLTLDDYIFLRKLHRSNVIQTASWIAF